MTRSATEVMEHVLVAAVLDALGALRAASGGMPNALLRDLQAIHANTTFADLPKEVRASVQASVRAAFRELQKEGYAVGPAAAIARPAATGREPPRHPHGRGPQHRKGPGGRPPPKSGGPRRDGGPGRGPGPKGR